MFQLNQELLFHGWMKRWCHCCTGGMGENSLVIMDVVCRAVDVRKACNWSSKVCYSGFRVATMAVM